MLTVAHPLPWTWDDGGRERTGFRGQTGDCVCRAVAIATGLPYQQVYDDLAMLGAKEHKYRRRSRKSHPRTGIYIQTTRRYLASLGWAWTPTMHIGSGCTVHLRYGELPETGRLIVSISRHIVAVIYGVIHDLSDPSRRGTRCVYGYWTQPQTNRIQV
jgi:hypothetical protein